MIVSGHIAIAPEFKERLAASKPPNRDYTVHPVHILLMDAKTNDKLLHLTRVVIREAIVNKHNIQVLAKKVHKQKKAIVQQGADISKLQKVVLKLKRERSSTEHTGILEILYIYRGSHCFLT